MKRKSLMHYLSIVCLISNLSIILHLCIIQINGRVSFEGILKIYWGLKKPITVLSERELMRRGSQRVESVMAAVEKVRAKMRRKKEEIAKQTIEVSTCCEVHG